MQLSAQGLDLIKRSEGFRRRQYLDAAGYETIGYGHKIAPTESFPEEIAEAEAEDLLMSDVKRAEQAVSRLAHVPLSQGQFDALVDFCFNVGAGRLAASTLLKELNAGRYAQAGLQLLRWDYAAGQPNAALKTRRTAELQLWTCGNPAGQTAPAALPANAAASGEMRLKADGGELKAASSPTPLCPQKSPRETVKLPKRMI